MVIAFAGSVTGLLTSSATAMYEVTAYKYCLLIPILANGEMGRNKRIGGTSKQKVVARTHQKMPQMQNEH